MESEQLCNQPVPGRISSNGNYLTFSPLYTSDTGRYTCTLSMTSIPYVVVQEPKTSQEKALTVNSRCISSIPFLSL